MGYIRNRIGAWLVLGACAGAWAQPLSPVPAAAPAASTAAPSALTAADFARNAQIVDAELSPSGHAMALIGRSRDGRQMLALVPLNPPGPTQVLVAFKDADVLSASWVNDKRLVYTVMAEEGSAGMGQDGGTFAIDASGERQLRLIDWVRSTYRGGGAIKSRLLPATWGVVRAVGDGSDDVLVQEVRFDSNREVRGVTQGRLDSVTGKLDLSVGQLPDRSSNLISDRQGVVRLVSVVNGNDVSLRWRDAQDAPWRELAHYDASTREALTPLAIGADGQVLVTTSRFSGFQSLHTLDPKTGKVDPQPLVAVKGFDVNANVVIDARSREELGVRFAAQDTVAYWFDDEMHTLQRQVDAALPAGRTNVLLCKQCQGASHMLVYSSSSNDPGAYWLYDRKAKTLAPMGAVAPWLKPELMGQRTFHWVPTRDGKRMPVVVTHPPGVSATTPLPTVVLVHGGPYVPGTTTAFSSEAQFLATRGYRVLEPNFRGTEGYGWDWFRAGWKQWGQAMQTDLVDALNWAADQRLSDAKRACVAGGSYGGYAALMAPIATPGVFRCAISLVGVTDISLMFNVTWSDQGEEVKRGFMTQKIGSPTEDAAMLAANSPLKRVGEIKIPLFVAQGGRDVRVPPVHAERFRDAALAAGVDMEFKMYSDEGHGFHKAVNQQDYYERVERFLAKHLK